MTRPLTGGRRGAFSRLRRTGEIAADHLVRGLGVSPFAGTTTPGFWPARPEPLSEANRASLLGSVARRACPVERVFGEALDQPCLLALRLEVDEHGEQRCRDE